MTVTDLFPRVPVLMCCDFDFLIGFTAAVTGFMIEHFATISMFCFSFVLVGKINIFVHSLGGTGDKT